MAINRRGEQQITGSVRFVDLLVRAAPIRVDRSDKAFVRLENFGATSATTDPQQGPGMGFGSGTG